MGRVYELVAERLAGEPALRRVASGEEARRSLVRAVGEALARDAAFARRLDELLDGPLPFPGGAVISARDGSVAAWSIDSVHTHTHTHVAQTPLDRRAQALARQVLAQEEREWKRLVGGDLKPIDLAYTYLPEPGRNAGNAAERGRQVAARETVPDIAAYYRRITPRRLLITGAPGAGKTVLALDLMIALIRPPGEAAPRLPYEPVPVRLPLSGWDTDEPLRGHLTDRLIRAFGLSPAHARELVDERRILPVLDGLDEMDPPLPDGTPDPAAPRARAVLSALNDYQDGLQAAPVILLCRTGHYEVLRDGPLRDATRVEIAPVAPDDARAYLTDRAKDPARWEPLLRALRDEPDGTLARFLSTPWRLCLTATVYEAGGDPAGLLGFATPAALDAHLLARYVPAATRLRARPGYPAERVHAWLHRLARQMDDEGHPDIQLHRLWPLPGRKRVCVADGRVATALCALGTPFALLAPTPDRTAAALLMVLTSALFTSWTVVHENVNPPFVLHLRLLLSVPHRRGRAVAGAAASVALGLGYGLFYGYAEADRWAGLALGLGLGAALAGVLVLGSGFLTGLVGPPPRAASPRDGVLDDAFRGLLGGLCFGGGAGILFADRGGWAYGMAEGVSWGIGMALTLGAAGRRYAVFTLCARRDGLLPLRLGAFLDWACEAGLMRLSGPAYQFRHGELQRWLAEHPPGAVPSPSSPPPASAQESTVS
ncbi:NACHT domain-containing protein [Streptomyces sp. URMC 129]|uniref:NACHT domain-containing protein n=1 Tax=Streptomyces sp. URMC 129 TaxID=3423407 RepID=UPI003F1B5A58